VIKVIDEAYFVKKGEKFVEVSKEEFEKGFGKIYRKKRPQ
jgi:hypothetical protein